MSAAATWVSRALAPVIAAWRVLRYALELRPLERPRPPLPSPLPDEGPTGLGGVGELDYIAGELLPATHSDGATQYVLWHGVAGLFDVVALERSGARLRSELSSVPSRAGLARDSAGSRG